MCCEKQLQRLAQQTECTHYVGTRQVKFAITDAILVCPGSTGEALAEAQAKGPDNKGPSVSASASGSPRVPAHASKGIDQGYF